MEWDLDKVGDGARTVIAGLTHFQDSASAGEQWMRRAAEYCRWLGSMNILKRESTREAYNFSLISTMDGME